MVYRTFDVTDVGKVAIAFYDRGPFDEVVWSVIAEVKGNLLIPAVCRSQLGLRSFERLEDGEIVARYAGGGLNKFPCDAFFIGTPEECAKEWNSKMKKYLPQITKVVENVGFEVPIPDYLIRQVMLLKDHGQDAILLALDGVAVRSDGRVELFQRPPKTGTYILPREISRIPERRYKNLKFTYTPAEASEEPFLVQLASL
ncbi:MAG: hypothetical protein WC813_01650 [Patescibacteria group bacterium]|jgi:hypothetical protein